MPISAGTCVNIDNKLFTQLEAFESSLKAYLIASRVLHFDETGIEKKLNWIHVTSSDKATFYELHKNRGLEVLEEIDILPRFKGAAVHDYWNAYFSYGQVKHGLCNSHHLRELLFIQEHEKEDWAVEMKDFLLKAKQEVCDNAHIGYLTAERQRALEKEYEEIILKGLKYHSSLKPLPKNKRGKQKQRQGKNMLDRLLNKQDSVLLFMRNFSVPFTNSLADNWLYNWM